MTTTLFKTLGAATTLAGIIATAGSANAASLSYTTATNFANTDIVDSTISVQKFNSALGTLKKVTLNFVGDLTGDAKFESRNARNSTVTVDLSGEISLTQVNLEPKPLLLLTPQQVNSYNVSPFDGVTDFGGTSGRTLTGLSATKSTDAIFTDSPSLQVFTGTGNLDFLFTAFANSVVSGSGNITSSINTLAKASVQVTYDYDPAKSVPEPSAALGIGLIAGLGMLSQRKKSSMKVSNS
ncbi:choice-of-anchor E domain-containing protein [Nostoc sp. TCL26-01]|uniref:choice-of-anchor E domain-containing protein n=1 Tax=Nostoc sp. TCL26-01 TaxID=2576904 RepID=UPI0015BFB243|nr:choice-of-anchor E domain-containing protein [Nostoc sp. TCL26-01]QLE57799.1 choice-of-anchor E domain-containing protein [Nostoc sp. TCL26-01]